MRGIEMLACLGTYSFPSLVPSLVMSEENHGSARVLRTTSKFDVNNRMTIRRTWLAEQNKLKAVTLQGLSRGWRLEAGFCCLDSISIDYKAVSNRLFINFDRL
jgi:hypothetical protein